MDQIRVGIYWHWEKKRKVKNYNQNTTHRTFKFVRTCNSDIDVGTFHISNIIADIASVDSCLIPH